MGVLGIGANGDLITTAGDTVGRGIEIRCDDPRFLERAARKRPNVVTEFVGGTWSYMRDWGVGVNYCLMLMGVYGSTQQSRALRWKDIALDLIQFGYAQPELSYKIISLAVQHTYSTPAFVGRVVGGGILNTLLLTGGRYGAGIRSGRAVKLGEAASRSSALRPSNYTNGAMLVNAPVMAANFVLALTGSAVLTIKNGNADLASIFSAILTGDYESDAIGSIYADLFNEARRMHDVEISPEELGAMLQVLNAIEYCLNNPSSMGSMSEPRAEVPPQVPVGQVSSARPAGVMGLIDAGSETNMLDVLADQQMHNREN